MDCDSFGEIHLGVGVKRPQMQIFIEANVVLRMPVQRIHYSGPTSLFNEAINGLYHMGTVFAKRAISQGQSSIDKIILHVYDDQHVHRIQRFADPIFVASATRNNIVIIFLLQ